VTVNTDIYYSCYTNGYVSYTFIVTYSNKIKKLIKIEIIIMHTNE